MSDQQPAPTPEAPEIVLPPEIVEPAEIVDPGSEPEPTESVSSPAKVMRIGSMVKQLLEEVRAASLDEAGRDRLKAHLRAVRRPSSASRCRPTCATSWRAWPRRSRRRRRRRPSCGSPRPSWSGWLEGLFHGIQATLFAQQMAARQQLEQMRGQLPPGQQPGPEGPELRPGTYL